MHFFTKPEFQDDDGISADVNTTPNINMKNINVLTDYLQTADMRTPSGEVRPLFLTEMGVTSSVENGEARQAVPLASGAGTRAQAAMRFRRARNSRGKCIRICSKKEFFAPTVLHRRGVFYLCFERVTFASAWWYDKRSES